MEDDESTVVQRVLGSLQQYLYDKFPLEKDFIIRLKNAGLIDKNTEAKLCALAHSGDRSCIHDLITFMWDFWDEATLNKFCTFLEKYGKEAKPGMVQVAAKIREKLKGEVNEPGPSGSKRSQLPSDDQYPQSKRPYSTTKDPTAPRAGMEDKIGRSLDILKKYREGLIDNMKSLGAVLDIKHQAKAILSRNGSIDDHLLEILDLYINEKCPTWRDLCTALNEHPCFNNVREKIEADHNSKGSSEVPVQLESSGQGDGTSSADVNQHVYYPVIDELKISFSTLAGNVLSIIGSLSSKNFKTFFYFLSNYLRPSFPPDAPTPVIPETVQGLTPFLICRWDPLQIRLLKAVVENLQLLAASGKIPDGNFKENVQQVKDELNNYEGLLNGKLAEFLSKYRSESVSLKPLLGHTSVTVKIASKPEKITLARILELKGFFINNLGLPDTLFSGFSEGCIVLFFSIPTECVRSLSSCLHPSNLSLLEEWKVLFFSVKGAFTVDIKERRVDKLIRPILIPPPVDTQPSSTTSQTMAGTTATSTTGKTNELEHPGSKRSQPPSDDQQPPPKRPHSAQEVTTAPRAGMDGMIGSSLDILVVPEYKNGLIGKMPMLGEVLGMGDITDAIFKSGDIDDQLLKILKRYIDEKSPTWRDFCKALKKDSSFNKIREKIEADHNNSSIIIL